MHALDDTRTPAMERLLARSNLTQRQKLMWISQRLRPESPDANMAALFTVEGRLDEAAFIRAAQALVASCDCLRTVIEERDGVPFQRVHAAVEAHVDVVDLQAENDAAAALRRQTRTRTHTPFALPRRLFTITLFHLPDNRSAWLLVIHHLVSDGTSMRLLFDRLSTLYARAHASGGAPAPLDAPPFTDYVAAHLAWQQTPASTSDAAWWDARLSDAEPVMLYGVPAPTGGGAARRIALDLGGARSRRLNALADSHGMLQGRHQAMQNLFATVLCAWLHRVGPNDAPVVAFGFHNRTEAFRQTAGLLMQTVPVQAAIDADETFLTLLEKVTDAFMDGLGHSEHAVANPMRKRLWEVVLNYLPTGFSHFAGLAVEHEWVSTEHTGQALCVTVHDLTESGRLHLAIDLAVDAIEEPLASSLPGHILAFLDALLDNLHTRVGDVDFLSASERARLLRLAAVPPPTTPETLVAHFEAAVARDPRRPAVLLEDGHWTREALNRRANQLARRLVELGAGPGACVAIHLRGGPMLAVAVLAVLKSGASYLPLDSSHPPQRRAFMLQDAGPRAVITERALCDLPGDEGWQGARVVLDAAEEAAQAASRASENLPARATLDDIAYVIYTSGSTGTPKGVRITHRALGTFLGAVGDQWIDEGDAVYFTSPLTFDMHVGDLLLALDRGAAIIPVARETVADARRLRALFESGKGTASFATPATFRMLLDAGWKGDARMKALCGGETLPPDLAHDLSRRVQRLWNVYGPTETTCFVLWHTVTSGESPVPLGRPLAGVRLYIVDRYGRMVPEGVPGELLIGGAQLGRDYLARPALTAERFIRDPYDPTPGARVYRSGDLVRLRRDGTFEYLGRVDDQVKIRGYRIELGEIESALAQHGEVRQAVVCAREDVPGDRRLVAYISGCADVDALRSHLRRSLPEYMVPAAFVSVERFPLSPNGKIDRRQLPPPGMPPHAETPKASTDLLQFQIAKAFEDVLETKPVGLDDDFFALGGSSLLAVRLLSRLESALDRAIPSTQTLFDAPTPRALAAFLRRDGWQPSLAPLVLLQPRGEERPFFCVHAFIGDVCRDLGRCCGAEHPFYGFQPRGLDGREAPIRSVEEMAAFYVEQMRRVQPVGPYLIGGYSFGGYVAYEMARTLRARGETVALLAIIDTGVPNPPPRDVRGWLRRIINAPLIALEKTLRTLRAPCAHTLPLTVWRKLRMLFLRRRALTALERPEEDDAESVHPLLADMDDISHWPENYRRIARLNMLASARYRPQPYDGRVTLIRRRSRHHRFAIETPDWGWSDLGASVEVYWVDGDHDEIMVEPGVRQVGRIIEAQLRLTRSSASPPSAPPVPSNEIPRRRPREERP